MAEPKSLLSDNPFRPGDPGFLEFQDARAKSGEGTRTDPGSLRELRLLIDKYNPANSDWNFRKGVMLECLDRLSPHPP